MPAEVCATRVNAPEPSHVAAVPAQRSRRKPSSDVDWSDHARLMRLLDAVVAVRPSGASGGGPCVPQLGSRNAPIRVCQPAMLVTAIYSAVAQNVQPSTGSTVSML